eukprot:gene34358-46082_t
MVTAKLSSFTVRLAFTIVVFIGSVTSIGSSAFGNCRSLKAVVILPTTISIGYSAFEGDSNLTRIDATLEICAQVLDTCRGTCTKFRGCLTRVYVSTPLSEGFIIATIVICADIWIIVCLVLCQRCFRRTPNTEYGAVGTIEMQTLPGQDGSVEAC